MWGLSNLLTINLDLFINEYVQINNPKFIIIYSCNLHKLAAINFLMNLNRRSENLNKLDVVFLIFLGCFSFLVMTIFMQNYGEVMIYYDAFKNYEYAQSLVYQTENTAEPYSPISATQISFMIYLTTIFSFFQEFANTLFYIRLFNLIPSVSFVIFFYLIARKLFSPFFALVGSMMAIFTPIMLVYSGTLESNLFSISSGFVSLYLSIRPKKLVNVLLSSFFIFLTSSRLDIFFAFVLPYLIGLCYYINSKIKWNFFILLSIVLLAVFIPSYFIIQSIGGIYGSNYFENNILKQVFALLTFDNIKIVFQSAVEITGDKAVGIRGDEGLNKLYLGILLFGLFYFFYDNKNKIQEILLNRNYNFQNSETVVVYLTILCLVTMFSLVSFHIPIEIVDGEIVPDDEILPRYMIELRLFFLFGFLYGLMLLTNFAFKRVSVAFSKEGESFTNNEVMGNLEKIRVIENVEHEKNKVSSNPIFPYVFAILIMAVFLSMMWETAVKFYQNDATQIQAYYQAVEWLKQNLSKDDKVLLPTRFVFVSIDPSLKDKSYDYGSIWKQLGIILRPETTADEVQTVRSYLKEFIHDNKNGIKFVVVDWVDPRAKSATGITPGDLIRAQPCEKFDSGLIGVKRFSFRLPHSDWQNSLVICRIR